MIDIEKLRDYGQANPAHPFDDIVDVLGGLTHVTPVTEAEIAAYCGRLPDGLLELWRKHGRGALLDGYAWLCDPKIFEPWLEVIFEGDPKFAAKDFSVFQYNFEGNINAWSARHGLANFTPTSFNAAVGIDGTPTPLDIHGQTMLHGLKAANAIRIMGYAVVRDHDMGFDEFFRATAQLGALQPGEIFAYVPSRRMGGSGEVETMRRVRMMEHLMFQAQLGPLTLERYIYDPNDAAHPMGRLVPVRPLGPQPR